LDEKRIKKTKNCTFFRKKNWKKLKKRIFYTTIEKKLHVNFFWKRLKKNKKTHFFRLKTRKNEFKWLQMVPNVSKLFQMSPNCPFGHIWSHFRLFWAIRSNLNSLFLVFSLKKWVFLFFSVFFQKKLTCNFFSKPFKFIFSSF